MPSPNVAEDHQRKNAQALADRDAAVMILDADSRQQLIPAVKALLADESRRASLAANIKAMALPDADEKIADRIYSLIQR